MRKPYLILVIVTVLCASMMLYSCKPTDVTKCDCEHDTPPVDNFTPPVDNFTPPVDTPTDLADVYSKISELENKLSDTNEMLSAHSDELSTLNQQTMLLSETLLQLENELLVMSALLATIPEDYPSRELLEWELLRIEKMLTIIHGQLRLVDTEPKDMPPKPSH